MASTTCATDPSLRSGVRSTQRARRSLLASLWRTFAFAALLASLNASGCAPARAAEGPLSLRTAHAPSACIAPAELPVYGPTASYWVPPPPVPPPAICAGGPEVHPAEAAPPEVPARVDPPPVAAPPAEPKPRRSAARAAPAADARPVPAPCYSLQPGVVLSPRAKRKVMRIAHGYHKRTGKALVVTSGTRNAAQQAEAMHELLRLGANVMSLYKNKDAVGEIKRAYEQGRAASRPQRAVVAAMTAVIQRQVQRGIYISAHLRAGAVDIRNRDMTAADKRAFLEAVAGADGVSALEESRPPHFHLQVD